MMVEGIKATATATDQGSLAAPAQDAATAQTLQVAGEGAGQTSQQAQEEMASIAKAELDSLKANSGRFQAIQQRGDLDFMSSLQTQGLTAKDVRETLEFLGKDLPPGVTVSQILAAIRTPSAPPAQADGQPQRQQMDPNDPERPMTVAEFKRMQSEQSQQEKEAAAEREVKQFWDGLTKEFKVTGGAKAKSLRGIISDAEKQVIAEDLQKNDPYLSPEKALAQAEQYIPAKDQLARARKIVEDDWKDLGNEIVSAAAAGQAGLPAGTLGGGPGGAPPPPGKVAGLTSKEQADAVLAGIRKVTASRGYVPPAR
ncbi:MAG TPA: hypothetical protein VMW52_06520 [Phycisphaerae bacterium]|nr:hypothetical protein [Phycisphaerae bacterium]